MDLKARPKEFKPYRPFSNDPPLKPPAENLGNPKDINPISQESAGQTKPNSTQQPASFYPSTVQPLNNSKTADSTTPLSNINYKENLIVASKKESIIKKFFNKIFKK